MTLSFFVEKQKITRTDTETPAANSNCYLKAKFEFGNDWDVSSSVCPIFRRGGEDSGYMPQLKDGRFLDEQNICFVPIEVLNKEGRFFVSIFDYKNGKTITTNEAMVEVFRSGPVFNSPTIYSLDLRFENENLQLTANGEAVGEGVEIPKQEIDDAMSDTSENPVQNKIAKAYTDEKTKATPTDITLTDNLLQLTANGEAVGSGVTIPAPKETFVKTYFDYTKLKDVLIGKLNAFSINHNLASTNTKNVYIRFQLIKDKLDESTGVLVVQPALTGLPSVIYGSTYSEKTFDSNEKVGLSLLFEYEGEKYVFSEEDFKEYFSNENTEFKIGFDTASLSYTIIIFEFRANYEDIDTANAIKSSIKDEILPMFSGMQVAIDRVNWTEKESEIVYAE